MQDSSLNLREFTKVGDPLSNSIKDGGFAASYISGVDQFNLNFE
jgi:hypothetical protein